MVRLTLVLLSLAVFVACQPDEDKNALFTRIDAKDSGIDFINWNNETEETNILTYEYLYNGGGVALGDINNDGLIDIYFTSNSDENKLYLNLGNFKFKDITQTSGAACEPGWKTGVAMVDINADGWLDIYICRSAHTNHEKRKNALLINNGDLTFTEKAAEYGLDDDSFSTQAAFFDYDHDGDLDVILLNHSLLQLSNSYDITKRNTTLRQAYVGNKFFRNDNGKFTDVSDSIGVYGPASNYGLGISLSDINNDGWIDMYTTCDYTGRDKLLLNNNGRSFQDVTDSLLSHISKFTMGMDIADINGDGFMDIYTLDMLPEDNRRQKQLFGSDRFDVFSIMVKSGLHYQYMRNMLHLNNGNGTFSEIGQLAGIANTDWSWGALFADYNNDGIQDLFVSNGFKRDLTDNDFTKYDAFKEIEAAVKQGKKMNTLKVIDKFTENKLPNYIFQGNGDLTFTNVTMAWGLGEPTLTNGIAYGDLDNDGDLDLVMNNVNDKAGIYRNNAERLLKNHFLRVRLIGRDKNTAALGTKVTLFYGTKRMVREMLPVRGFQSSVDPVLHFGLGSVDKIDSVLVQWPRGERQMITVDKVDQVIRCDQSHAREKLPAANDFKKDNRPYFKKENNIITFAHHENNFTDFHIQALLPRMYSTQGPALAHGDVNNDGISDIYAGGAKGQMGELWVSNKEHRFTKTIQPDFKTDLECEDVDAVFFDMDNDGDLDLYVVSGGYEYASNDKFLQDRIYKNDGTGKFSKAVLPAFFVSGACVRQADIDNDGDMDLFVGSRLIPGQYPNAPDSYILINDGNGIFSFSTNNQFKSLGLVTDAVWLDINKDNQQDLIVVGEWMPVHVFINEGGKLTDKSSLFIKDKTNGWWNCILAADFDKDGDMDLVIGNYGLNSQAKVSQERPALLVFDDFDKNNSIDPLLNYYIQDKSYPYPTRDELTEQLPSFKKRFTNYASYSEATIEKVLSADEFARAHKLYAYEFQTCYFQNDINGFTIKAMPIELQFSPVFSMVAMDVNMDGQLDIISGGNLSSTRARTGKMSGNPGFIFLGDGKGNFQHLPALETGINAQGDVRHMVVSDERLIIGINNSDIEVYSLTKDY